MSKNTELKAVKAPKEVKKVVPTPKAKAKPEVKEVKERKLSKIQVAILKVLAKTNGGLSRPVLTEKIKTFIGSSALGQQDVTKLVPTSLQGRGYVKVGVVEGGPLEYTITAAGRNALKSAE